MACCTSKSILLQAAAIVAVGAAAGAADWYLRPIQLGRAAPPPLDLTTPARTDTARPDAPKPGPTTPGRTTPGPTTPAPTTPGPTTPAPTTPAPAAGAFKPTPKSELPAGQITLDEAKALFDRDATFIDTRKPEEFAAGHVARAFRISNADFTHGDPPILAAVPRDAVIVCYCVGGHCDESEQVARNLAGSGYAKVYVMHDGFPGWKAMGFPVETGEGLQ